MCSNNNNKKKTSNPQLHNVSALLSQWRTHGLKLMLRQYHHSYPKCPGLRVCYWVLIHFHQHAPTSSQDLGSVSDNASPSAERTASSPSPTKHWAWCLRKQEVLGGEERKTRLISFFFLSTTSPKRKGSFGSGSHIWNLDTSVTLPLSLALVFSFFDCSNWSHLPSQGFSVSKAPSHFSYLFYISILPMHSPFLNSTASHSL